MKGYAGYILISRKQKQKQQYFRFVFIFTHCLSYLIVLIAHKTFTLFPDWCISPAEGWWMEGKSNGHQRLKTTNSYLSESRDTGCCILCMLLQCEHRASLPFCTKLSSGTIIMTHLHLQMLIRWLMSVVTAGAEQLMQVASKERKLKLTSHQHPVWPWSF